MKTRFTTKQSYYPNPYTFLAVLTDSKSEDAKVCIKTLPSNEWLVMYITKEQSAYDYLEDEEFENLIKYAEPETDDTTDIVEEAERVKREVDKREIRNKVVELLNYATSSEYGLTIADSIIDEVVEDVYRTADALYNDTDIKYAIGRVLIYHINKD